VKRPAYTLPRALAYGVTIVTLIYIRYSIVPITNVDDLRSFALKIIITVVVANVVGVGLYVVRKQR